MKLRLILATCVLALAACAGTPLLTQETVALKSVTLAREASTAALRAGRISLANELRNKAIFDAMVQSIKDAVAANDPEHLAAVKSLADDAATQLKGAQ